ncbi:MAG: hydroxyacid dehydrogenase, partial [Rhodocyclaceae bacterium]|nr:hydroxyacid dehydrogenase [Rhodocyclaceae bacterium]
MSGEAFNRHIAAIVGESAMVTGADMAPYLTDWRGRYTGRARCVVKPAGTGEVAAVVALCARERVPMVPQG